MLLTPNFDDSEFDAGEAVPVSLYPNRNRVAELLQSFRDLTGSRIKITRCYSDPVHNATVGGVSDSQHLTAEAADVEFLDMSQEQVATQLLAAESAGSGPSYSQCIFYANDPHVHIGLPFTDGRENGQKLVNYDPQTYKVLDDTTINDLSTDTPNPSLPRPMKASNCRH